MVSKHIVPFCDGNYKTDCKVAPFGVPKYEKLKMKQIAASHRKVYIVFLLLLLLIYEF